MRSSRTLAGALVFSFAASSTFVACTSKEVPVPTGAVVQTAVELVKDAIVRNDRPLISMNAESARLREGSECPALLNSCILTRRCRMQRSVILAVSVVMMLFVQLVSVDAQSKPKSMTANGTPR